MDEERGDCLPVSLPQSTDATGNRSHLIHSTHSNFSCYYDDTHMPTTLYVMCRVMCREMAVVLI